MALYKCIVIIFIIITVLLPADYIFAADYIFFDSFGNFALVSWVAAAVVSSAGIHNC